MIRKPPSEDHRTPAIIIMDNTPISLLGSIGELDWLLKPTGTVWMTDVVMEEALRLRIADQYAREIIAAWIGANRYRIKVVETKTGRRIRQGLRLWELAGRPEDDRPDMGDLGERSVYDAVSNARDLPTENESFLAIMDDREGRDAMKLVRADVDLMGTRTFIRWLSEDHGIGDHREIWVSIFRATRGTADPGLDDDQDPVYIRRR